MARSIKFGYMQTTLSVVIRIVLWFVMLVGGAVYALRHDWHTPLFTSVVFHAVLAGLGIGLLALAFRAAANGGKELSKGRVGDTPRLETNRLVTTGIYRCMRHPMLFGLTLLPMGWALLLGSPTFIMLIAPFEILFIVVMVIVFEEIEVHRKFGEAYAIYSRKVPMISWRWACLNALFKKGKR